MRSSPSGRIAPVGRRRSVFEEMGDPRPVKRSTWYVVAAVMGTLAWVAFAVWVFLGDW